jgi:hypothetical protein
MTRAMLLGLLLAVMPAQAGVKVLGFSADSSAVAWVTSSEGDMLPEGEPIATLTIRDLNTLKDTDVPYTENAPDSLDAARDAITRARGAGAWVAAKASQSSPDGKARLDVNVTVLRSGSWSGGHWTAQGSAGWEIGVARDGQTLPVISVAAADALTAFWSPNGHRVLLVVTHQGTNMRDPGNEDVIVGSDGAPALSIVGPTLSAAQATAGTLSGAGFVVTSITRAKKGRDATVVYAAKGREALAAEVAKKLPGATVAPLDWPSPFAVVVALGGK